MSDNTDNSTTSRKIAMQETWTEEKRAKQRELVSERNKQKGAERWKDLPEMLKTMTQSEIARTLGVAQSAVAQRIRKYGIKVERSPDYETKVQNKRENSAVIGRQKRDEEVEKRWDHFDLAKMYKTMKQVEIAEIIGVTQEAVSKRLRKLGITK